MTGTKELRTPRLLLRKHVKADAKPLHENFGRDEVMFEYSGWNPYATPEMAEKAVAEYIASYGDPRFYGWGIEAVGRLVGTIGAYDFDVDKSTIEVGMSIERASWGRGYATEALQAVLGYLTGEEKIATVTAWCASDNIGSRRALEKAGMVKVEVEKAALAIGDATFDKLWYEFHNEVGEDGEELTMARVMTSKEVEAEFGIPAEQLGMKRSDYLRHLVDEDLRLTGIA